MWDGSKTDLLEKHDGQLDMKCTALENLKGQ